MNNFIENVKAILWVLFTPIERIIDKPLLFFGVITFLMNRDWISAIFLVLTWVGAGIWLTFVVIQKNVKTYTEFLETYLSNYSHCTFRRYSLKDFFKNEELWVFKVNRALQQSILENTNNHIVVVKRKKKDSGKLFPATYTTFPIAYDSSYIMVTEDPKDMNSFQRFCLYHELGHISGVQSEIQDRVLLNQTQGFILVLVIAIVTQGNPLAIFSSAIFYWLWNSTGKNITENREVDYEILADTYALFMTANDHDFHRASKLFFDYIQDVQYKSSEFLQRRIHAFNTHKELIESLKKMSGESNLINLLDFPLSNILSKGVSKLLNVSTNTPEFNQAFGYLASTGIQWDPSTKIYMLVGFLIGFSAVFVSNLNTWSLISVGVLLIVLPFMCFLTTIYRQEQLKFQVSNELYKLIIIENDINGNESKEVSSSPNSV